MLLLVLGMALAAPTDVSPAATACLARNGTLPNDLRLDTLRRALQSRLLKRNIRVSLCDNASTVTWQITLASASTSALQLDVVGQNVAHSEVVDLAGLTELEAVQVTALSAIEAIRPAMDRLTLELGTDAVTGAEPTEASAEPKTWPKAESSLTAEPAATVAVQEPAYRDRRLLASATVGPIVDDRGIASLWAEVGGSFPVGLFAITSEVGFKQTFQGDAHGLDVDRYAFELGLGAERRFRSLTLGAQGRLQLAHVGVAGTSVDAANPGLGATAVDAASTHVRVGAAVTVMWSLWRARSFEIAIAARAWFWPQPHKMTYQGQGVVSEAFFEGFMGPTFRVNL